MVLIKQPIENETSFPGLWGLSLGGVGDGCRVDAWSFEVAFAAASGKNRDQRRSYAYRFDHSTGLHGSSLVGASVGDGVNPPADGFRSEGFIAVLRPLCTPLCVPGYSRSRQ